MVCLSAAGEQSIHTVPVGWSVDCFVCQLANFEQQTSAHAAVRRPFPARVARSIEPDSEKTLSSADRKNDPLLVKIRWPR